jgi:hypothetical protein
MPLCRFVARWLWEDQFLLSPLIVIALLDRYLSSSSSANDRSTSDETFAPPDSDLSPATCPFPLVPDEWSLPLWGLQHGMVMRPPDHTLHYLTAGL